MGCVIYSLLTAFCTFVTPHAFRHSLNLSPHSGIGKVHMGNWVLKIVYRVGVSIVDVDLEDMYLGLGAWSLGVVELGEWATAANAKI